MIWTKVIEYNLDVFLCFKSYGYENNVFYEFRV